MGDREAEISKLRLCVGLAEGKSGERLNDEDLRREVDGDRNVDDEERPADGDFDSESDDENDADEDDEEAGDDDFDCV